MQERNRFATVADGGGGVVGLEWSKTCMIGGVSHVVSHVAMAWTLQRSPTAAGRKTSRASTAAGRFADHIPAPVRVHAPHAMPSVTGGSLGRTRRRRVRSPCRINNRQKTHRLLFPRSQMHDQHHFPPRASRPVHGRAQQVPPRARRQRRTPVWPPARPSHVADQALRSGSQRCDHRPRRHKDEDSLRPTSRKIWMTVSIHMSASESANLGDGD